MSTMEGFIRFAEYLGLSLAMLATFTSLYIHVTPYDDLKEIAAGNLAPAIALSGAILGYTFPLVVASYLHASIPGFLFWGLMACLVQLAVFWAMYRFLPAIVATHNAAGAMCYATVSLCVGLINAASFIP